MVGEGQEDEEPDFKSDMKIDEMNLEKEWLRQPSLVFYYGEMEANARARLEHLKLKMDIALAKLKKSIAKNPEKFGLVKNSDPAIQAAVESSETYQMWQGKIINAKKNLSILTAAVNAVEHRKRSLEKLVDLFIRNYYAEPHPNQDGRKMIRQNGEDRRKSKARYREDGKDVRECDTF